MATAEAVEVVWEDVPGGVEVPRRAAVIATKSAPLREIVAQVSVKIVRL